MQRREIYSLPKSRVSVVDTGGAKIIELKQNMRYKILMNALIFKKNKHVFF